MLRCVILGIAVVSGAFSAQADTISKKYTSVEGWDVSAVYNKETRAFSFCTASAIYKDYTYFMINIDSAGLWSLSLFNRAWPKKMSGTIPITLIVDDRVVDRSDAQGLSNGVWLSFGNSTEKVIALMRGRALAIATRQGSSRFSLDGSFKAALAALECWRLHSNAVRESPNGGAFGTTQTAETSDGPFKLSRAETMEVAAAYLGRIGVPYEVVAEENNFLTHLPVNWRYGSNSIGGMLVLGGKGLSGEETLASLLADQSRLCTGKSGTSRLAPERESDATYYSAKGACEMEGGSFSALYSVVEGSGYVVVIVELVDADDGQAHPSLQEQRIPDGALLSKFNRN